jgi:hypothetical protein
MPTKKRTQTIQKKPRVRKLRQVRSEEQTKDLKDYPEMGYHRRIIYTKSMTRKRTCCKNGIPSKRILIGVFMEMLHAIKLYHWNTHSYAEHKATDELHERLSSNIDKFVEVFLGKDASRLRHVDKKIRLLNSHNAHNFKQRIYEYREFMIGLSSCFHKTEDSDLLNIRDEILADLNQFLYLMTLDK